MWTRFRDMHSGGGQKLDWAYIFIEAPEAEAKIIFQNRFGRNPERVTCTCCGEDYSTTENEDLAQSTAYDRGCDSEYTDADGKTYTTDDWYKLPIEKRRALKFQYVERPRTRYSFDAKQVQPLSEYLKRDNIHIVKASDIKPEERVGTLRSEGYVWAGDED